MARPINFDSLNLDNTEYIAPDFIITPPEEPPIWVIDENNGLVRNPPALGLGEDYNIKTEETLEILPPLGGGNIGTIAVTPTGQISNGGLPETGSGNVLMTMTGAQTKPTQTGTNNAPVADLTAKIQTLAAEKPLLVFGAIGLGLYFLLKDKK